MGTTAYASTTSLVGTGAGATGPTLSMSEPQAISFPPVVLDGRDQLIFSDPFSISSEQLGTQAGFHINVSSGQFSPLTASGPSLPMGSVFLNTSRVTVTSTPADAVPPIVESPGIPIDASSATVIDAVYGAGVGDFTYSNLTLMLVLTPQTHLAFQGNTSTYGATVLWTISSGP